jgi:hypothetical protein
MEYPIWIALPVRKAEETCKKESSRRPKTPIQLLTLLRLESGTSNLAVPHVSVLSFRRFQTRSNLSELCQPPMELRLWYIAFLLGLTRWVR